MLNCSDRIGLIVRVAKRSKKESPDARSGRFIFSVDSRSLSTQTLSESPLLKRARSFRGCPMYRPPLSNRPALADKKVLLIDRCQTTREVRAAVLRSRGVEVYEAEEISAARFLWQPNVYDLVMLDVRRYSPEEMREFYEQVKGARLRQEFAFLMGSPRYLSRA